MGDDMAVMEIRIRRVEEELVKNQSAHAEIFARVGVIEKDLAVITAQNENIAEMLRELKGDLRCLKDKPSKKLDTLWAALAGAVVSGSVAFVISNIINR